MVGLVLAGAVVALVAAVAVAVALWPSGDNKITSTSGPLRTPINFLRVESESPGACSGGGVQSTDGQTCYRLSGGMTVRQLRSINAQVPDANYPQWRINVGLRPPEAQAFAELTGRVATAPPGSPSRKIAIVVGDRVVSAPEVQQVIPNGQVQISGQFNKQSAEQLIQQITGSN